MEIIYLAKITTNYNSERQQKHTLKQDRDSGQHTQNLIKVLWERRGRRRGLDRGGNQSSIFSAFTPNKAKPFLSFKVVNPTLLAPQTSFIPSYQYIFRLIRTN